MKIHHSLVLTLAFATVIVSCGTTGKIEKKDSDHPFGASEIPPEMRRGGGSTPPIMTGGTAVVAGGNKPLLSLTPEEDIVYTNPDDPDAGLPELATLLTNPKSGPWEQSETIAKQRSTREGKPLLIWFTDSQRSPMCKAVSQELFSKHEFGDWATDKIIRLKVDANFVKDKESTESIDDSEDRRVRVRDYAAELKKRYKIMGYPSMIMLSPSGEVVGRYRGYKRGDAQFLWGQLKHSEAVSSMAYQSWRTGLEKKGYREWSDRKDRKIFARMTSYSKGNLTFIEPNGTRSKTSEINLSNKDKQWIAEQKKMRNIQ